MAGSDQESEYQAGLAQAGLAENQQDEEGGDFVSAFAKGLAVIQAFGEDAPALAVAEVAHRTNFSRASARRLLITLETLGFAARLGEKKFVLTPKVLLLGNAYLSSMPMWRFAEPVLEKLVSELGETCSLSVLDGHEVVYVLRIPVRRVVMDRVSTVGSHLPAYCSSMGRLLLAMLPEAQRERFLREVVMTAYTDKTITDRKQLRAALDTVRKRGYAWVSDEMQENVKGLAVPVYDIHGQVSSALAVSISSDSVDSEAFIRKVLPDLSRAAMRLSASMSVHFSNPPDSRSRRTPRQHGGSDAGGRRRRS